MSRRWVRRGLLLASLVIGWLAWYAFTPAVSVGQAYPTEFSVPPGSTLKGVAVQLESQGVIRHALVFTMLGRLAGKAGQLKAGSYQLPTPASPWELLRKMTAGETVLGKITIIEGWTFREMRVAIEAHPGLKHDSAGMSDRQLLAAIGVQAAHPEGLFFPDTYYFDVGSSDIQLFKRAYIILQHDLDQAWRGRAANLPYKHPYEALIMASIIEKETGVADERPQIAAVFINRLRLGMRLQTDPTVIYGLGASFDGNLRKNDLLMDTPYNTYTRGGLPPTPIALPSLGAIQAALHPAESRDLYFVARGGGRHYFSSSLDEHNRAVARYQKGGR